MQALTPLKICDAWLSSLREKKRGLQVSEAKRVSERRDGCIWMNATAALGIIIGYDPVITRSLDFIRKGGETLGLHEVGSWDWTAVE